LTNELYIIEKFVLKENAKKGPIFVQKEVNKKNSVLFLVDFNPRYDKTIKRL